MCKHRSFSRFLTTVILMTFATSISACPAIARARLIAVITLRSTASAHHAAVAASKALAARLAQEPGWDAVTVSADAKGPADAAAAAGAEIYVIGRYLPGNPPSVVGAAYRVATDERITDFSFSVGAGGKVPAAVSFAQITALRADSTPAVTQAALAAPATAPIPSGDLISVMILKDIGSRISQEGDTFAVETIEDYYYKGQLILPKGSPGYGVITHLKRAGSFHAGGELNFTVKRLITPAKTDLLVETNGATADADKVTEHNGNAFGQYLLWGVGMFAKRGNDILVKKGTTFHVSTMQNDNVPIAAPNAQPAALDPAYFVESGQTYAPALQPQPQSTPAPLSAISAPAVITPPAKWIQKKKDSMGNDVMTVGYWTSPESDAINLEVVEQGVPDTLPPSQIADLTLRSLQNAIGPQNVLAFHTERICNGNTSGWYIQSAVSIGITRVVAEQTLGIANGESYVATYRRPATTPENATARSALDTLCPT